MLQYKTISPEIFGLLKSLIDLLELEDLVPMKLSAIAGRGAKKDFYDIYFLLEKFPLTRML